MGYQITISYGDFVLSHADEEETLAAMQSGVYATAFRHVVAQMSNMIESGILDEDGRDVDEEAAALIAGEDEEE